MKLRTGKIYVGAAGRATEILFEGPYERPDVEATLAMWFFDCPGQSPAWRHYHLSIVHLRTMEGVKPAVITRKGATHQVILVAFDPKENPVPDDMETWCFLRPVNFIGQLTLPSDEHAKKALEVLAKAVAEGMLWAEPPLSLQTEPWESQLRHLEAHAAGQRHLRFSLPA